MFLVRWIGWASAAREPASSSRAGTFGDSLYEKGQNHPVIVSLEKAGMKE